MQILEFGNKKNSKIILIHGFESPYQIWEEYIEHYKKDFHIIVPILQGHNPDLKEEFTSIKESAKEIEDFYTSQYGNDVYAIYGMSMGGIIASQLWENKNLNISKLILESSPLLSYNRFMTFILTKNYLMLTHKTQQRDEKIVKQAINSIISEDKLEHFLRVLDNMSDTTIINYLNEAGKYNLPNNIDTPDTEIIYYHGTTINEMLAKKTAKYIKKYYPNSQIICFNGKGHCEISLMDPKSMIKELNKVLVKK